MEIMAIIKPILVVAFFGVLYTVTTLLYQMFNNRHK